MVGKGRGFPSLWRELTPSSPFEVHQPYGVFQALVLNIAVLFLSAFVESISEAFTSIAHYEFYYKQVLENMRSIGGSFLFVGYAISKTKEEGGNGDWLAMEIDFFNV
ncbi:protein NRT1/ PTR FAMILY 2.11-like [Cucumis melo var. makuwa]|uniref:Protein NRT1/ PTR FAMILY 2.11-like n=1 Tax=Cucumis melo var. makuwa TaxID=1194695 RepID=A0A5D3BH54_CUCMM|nr:protein NRT1/ PTR FAMILY 2.11-like [Cucumis melo var. makuwa]